MSLFRIYVDGELFYHPYISRLAVTKAEVQENAENIDSLTLAAPYNHPYLKTIKPMASTIVCKKGEAIVFEGRALDDGMDFYKTHTWKCESALSYFKDSLQPPYSYTGNIIGLLEYFVETHNQQVEDKKKFRIGTVSVADNNDYISYSNSDYSVTLDAIRDKLVKTHGGYLQVRYTEEGKILDYLSDFTAHSTQSVEFGKNLLDVKINTDHTERYTALIPLGGKISGIDDEGNEIETGTRLDISSVNNGVNYLVDEKAVEEIGWIWAIAIWDDVNLAENLLTKGKARIIELAKGITSMELTIVDESDTDASIGDIRARQYVYCKSKPHGIDGTYLCLGKTTDYLNPSGNKITIGATGVTLTSSSIKQSQNISSLEQDIAGKTEEIKELTNKVGEVDNLKVSVQECYSEIVKTSEQITSTVNETCATKNEVETVRSELESNIEQTAKSVRVDISSLNTNMEERFNQINKYFVFDINGLTIGQADSPYKVIVDNDRFSMTFNGVEVLWIDAITGEINIPSQVVTEKSTILYYEDTMDEMRRVNTRYVGGEN